MKSNSLSTPAHRRFSAARKLIRESGFFTPRPVIALFLSLCACLIAAGTLPGFFQPDGSGKSSRRTLSFAERVAYQYAIEDVYWRHRIWPKERPDKKPTLDAVMSQAQLEKKVTDHLRKSQALEDYWQRPITAAQLQAEMDRMAKQTKQPDVLRELFAALGNDPYVIAECLAKPALAERALTNWYRYDQTIHGELRRRAEADLLRYPAVAQMKGLRGKYSEIELIKRESLPEKHNGLAGRVAQLSNREWDQAVNHVAAMFANDSAARAIMSAKIASVGEITAGILSPLQEDETCYYVVAVISKSDGHLKLATVAWNKEPLESWLDRAEKQVRSVMPMASSYTLPSIADEGSACTDDTWAAIANTPASRAQHTAVWTGSEMIVWGGRNYDRDLNTGDKYNPATDAWSPATVNNAPEPRSGQTAIWTGTEMIVWGGYGFFGALGTGGKYDPAANSWTPTAMIGAPVARYSHIAVWTGSEMIVWGGFNGAYLNTGGKYNPANNSWIATTTTNVPVARYNHNAVWTGSEMIIWGGANELGYTNTGGKYNPTTNSWTSTNTTNAPSPRQAPTAVWSGTALIIWGGHDGMPLNTGGRYDPSTNSWTATNTVGAPSGRVFHTAIWSGTEMIVWGGNDFDPNDTNTGGKYDPTSNSWTATNVTNAPTARENHTALWTGSEMIVFGGGYGETLNTGGRYNPITDNWISTSTSNAPGGRYEHTATWTGIEMIVWGGELNNIFNTNTGGRYDPALDAWTATSTINAPDPRESHIAIWTGSEMIVWGGWSINPNGLFNSGGRYNPVSDSWSPTSLINAPSPRRWHTAVWSGTEMLVWGGESGSEVNTGGRYNPDTNAWTATSTTGAPTARYSHTAVWTGTEMIVWGGYPPWLGTGGRYNPVTNSWTATSTIHSPAARSGHTAVWTNSEMIIWGGFGGSDYLKTGGRYNPATNSWVATNTTNAPLERSGHAVTWSGTAMIIWGGYNDFTGGFLNSGGRYNPNLDGWTATSTISVPTPRELPTAIWSGNQMIVWGGYDGNFVLNTGGRYCAQSGPTPTPTPIPSPTPTPTPCTGRCTPTPRPRLTPAPRP